MEKYGKKNSKIFLKICKYLFSFPDSVFYAKFDLLNTGKGTKYEDQNSVTCL